MTAVYIHFPFCVQRCQYCDFITYAGVSHFIRPYLAALHKEMRLVLPGTEEADSVYFGGGTPSLLRPGQVAELIQIVDSMIGFDPNAEITLEANPGTVTLESLMALRKSGVNRLSLGIQSFLEEDLQILGRIHSVQQAKESIRDAQLAGFSNISLDLIFGLPGQTLKAWQRNLEEVLACGIQHLSLYSLIIEPDTPFERMVDSGDLVLPDEDLVADMFELAMDFLPKHGFQQYEISSWALGEDNESRHNKVYWKNSEYFGVGAGAHGKVGNYRVQNVITIAGFIQKMEKASDEQAQFSPALEEKIFVDKFTAMQESMLLGLRMTMEGVSESTFRNRHHADMSIVFQDEIDRILKNGLGE
ncbi:MAG: radical SAM family heme chaperone HemW [Chloroflexi bacterium]|nr:radical SAM family heme chaperone HemW [Chloroflexota bacterium]